MWGLYRCGLAKNVKRQNIWKDISWNSVTCVKNTWLFVWKDMTIHWCNYIHVGATVFIDVYNFSTGMSPMCGQYVAQSVDVPWHVYTLIICDFSTVQMTLA